MKSAHDWRPVPNGARGNLRANHSKLQPSGFCPHPDRLEYGARVAAVRSDVVNEKLEEMPMAMLFRLGAVTHHCDVLSLGQVLQEPKCELLAVVFDHAIPIIDGRSVGHLSFVATRELGP